MTILLARFGSLLLLFLSVENSHAFLCKSLSPPVGNHMALRSVRSDNKNEVVVSQASSLTTTTASKITTTEEVRSLTNKVSVFLPNRRLALQEASSKLAAAFIILATTVGGANHNNNVAWAKDLQIDVNNAVAREFTAFPGLYPTIAAKVVKGAPYKSKKEIYAILNEVEQERLRQYDSAIFIGKVDKSLQQFKNSQICKYECKNRVSDPYRDSQIKAVQAGRQGLD